MALHPKFPDSPYEILNPSNRWFPADEALRESTADKLMPPLVPALRKRVKEWRDGGYVGATATSKSLLTWWFLTPKLWPQADGTLAEFRYYFAQREALETINADAVWLARYDKGRVHCLPTPVMEGEAFVDM